MQKIHNVEQKHENENYDSKIDRHECIIQNVFTQNSSYVPKEGVAFEILKA